jgi:hypothetical protein
MAETNLSELDELERIAVLDKRVAGLLRELEITLTEKAELEFTLRQRLMHLEGTEQLVLQNKLKSPDAIELVLREKGGPMRAVDITDELRRMGFYNIDKQAVTSTLVRYNQKGKRFVRVAPNTFDLIERIEKQAK